MNYKNKRYTLMSKEDVIQSAALGNFKVKSKITDFAVLLGGVNANGSAYWWTKSRDGNGGAYMVFDTLSSIIGLIPSWRNVSLRPVVQLSSNVVEKEIYINKKVEFGEYPQYAPDVDLQKELELNYSIGTLKKTGKKYTTDLRTNADDDKMFKPFEHDEYEYNGKKYVRVKPNFHNTILKLSNGQTFISDSGKYIWIEVSPIKWIVNKKLIYTELISEDLLVSGIRFNGGKYDGKFEFTEAYMFLNTYFAKDIIPSAVHEYVEDKQNENNKSKTKKVKNPYEFNFNNVTEEDIIRGSIESGISVFLHGASSEGKSARVKQIDPDCEIIYLRNASPESLNGKSVYDASTGKMIDIEPTWLLNVQEKCFKEPDKLHIIFFDEITNALPSIQGIAFNIVLDREVNGKWKLPDNARIVAAGNDMKDSLAANQLAEPLFNRFAHVYIKTTPESWLKWASENNIHPSIYSYIAYKREKGLRSEYNGEKPNADPRKWEMASKVLYKTNNPQMLRGLVGEEITNEFVAFCNQSVITLEDVLNHNYTEEQISKLNTAERYATVTALSQVTEENLDKVRKVVTKIGPEFISIFDLLWTHGDEGRLERIAEYNNKDIKKL